MKAEHHSGGHGRAPERATARYRPAMFDPQHALLSKRFAAAAAALSANPADPAPWSEVAAALEPTRATEPELARIVDARDAAALAALVAEWHAGTRLLPEQDRGVLHSALKAFKKSLKLTRLDDESRIGGGAMSSGRKSGIVGIRPPDRFAREVWDELVRTGRLKGGRDNIYEMPPAPPGGAG